MVRRVALFLITAPLLGGCVIDSIPEGYTGPVAHIADSVTPRNEISTDFFTLAKINGFAIVDSLAATGNSGHQPAKPPVIIVRDVPTSEASFTIAGHTHYTAPVFALTNTVYDVTGDIKFAPLADHSYVVKGVLGEAYSAVWIEDAKTGEIAGQKIEVKGSAALGTFGKLGLQ